MSDEVEVVRHEEQLRAGTIPTQAGVARIRTVVDHERYDGIVPRGVEHADVERVGATSGDSGEIETLPDGSLSIPVFEEQIVVEKRLVVRERIIIRKRTVVEEHRIEADLRTERVEIDVDDSVADSVEVVDSTG
jgi:uncharacterized protein (TIGR02271 family)